MILEWGDFIEVCFDPTVGHRLRKLRPALVVSDGFFNNVLSSLTVTCPINLGRKRAPAAPAGCRGKRSGQLRMPRSLARHKPRTPAPRRTSHGVPLSGVTMARMLNGIGVIFEIWPGRFPNIGSPPNNRCKTRLGPRRIGHQRPSRIGLAKPSRPCPTPPVPARTPRCRWPRQWPDAGSGTPAPSRSPCPPAWPRSAPPAWPGPPLCRP